jgi:hypothetical protein
MVPSPTRMEMAAQITVALMPTSESSISSAWFESVLNTLGWKQPSGFARRLLQIRTPSPRTIREPLATPINGRPENFVPRPTEHPLRRASIAQSVEKDSRP